MTNYIEGNNNFEGSNKNEKYMWLNNKDHCIRRDRVCAWH